MKRHLSAAQKAMLDFIVRQHERTGIYPSVREIAHHMGFGSTNTVSYHLRRLEQAGCLVRSRQARSYHLPQTRGSRGNLPHLSSSHQMTAPTATSRARSASRSAPALRFPILGRVAAGEPILAEQNFDGVLELPSYFDPSGETFALRVQGNSMIEDGIFDGDLVIVRSQPTLANGEIGVAIIGDEATVKRIYDDGNAWRLVPANSALEPRIVPKDAADFRIAGKVIGVVRKLR
ncbi:MAG: transcriptional repressor LexA [Candidatus Sumerlaeaceae bacterium]